MTKCRMAMENSNCGKVCCCLECEDRANCNEICTELKYDCEDAISEENAMVEFGKSVLTVTREIANIANEKKRLEALDETMRKELQKAMEMYGVTTFENDFVKITHVAPTTKVSVDSKKLKAELPNVYEKYSKTSNVNGYVKITAK